MISRIQQSQSCAQSECLVEATDIDELSRRTQRADDEAAIEDREPLIARRRTASQQQNRPTIRSSDLEAGVRHRARRDRAAPTASAPNASMRAGSYASSASRKETYSPAGVSHSEVESRAPATVSVRDQGDRGRIRRRARPRSRRSIRRRRRSPRAEERSGTSTDSTASPTCQPPDRRGITTENVGTGPGSSPGSGAGARNDHTADRRLAPDPGTARTPARGAVIVRAVGLRHTDLRLALPTPARQAAVLGGMTAWREGLAMAGASVDGASTSVDLVVAPSDLARQAAATGAPAVLLEGRGGGRELRRAGYAVQRFLPLPDLERPHLLLPLGKGPAARYALETWRPAHTLAKRLRNRLVGALVRAGAFPHIRTEQTLGLRGNRATVRHLGGRSAGRSGRMRRGSSRSDRAIPSPASPSTSSHQAIPSRVGHEARSRPGASASRSTATRRASAWPPPAQQPEPMRRLSSGGSRLTACRPRSRPQPWESSSRA